MTLTPHRDTGLCVCVCVCVCVCERERESECSSDPVKPLSSITFGIISSKKEGTLFSCTLCVCVCVCVYIFIWMFVFVCSFTLCVCVHACVLMYLMVLSDKCSFNQTLEFFLSLIMWDLMMQRALLSSLKQTLLLLFLRPSLNYSSSTVETFARCVTEKCKTERIKTESECCRKCWCAKELQSKLIW